MFALLRFLGFDGRVGKPPDRRGETDAEAIERRENHAAHDQQNMQHEGTDLRSASIAPAATIPSQDKFRSETDRQDILTGTP